LPLANGGTASTSAPQANATLMGWTTTATASGTTTLTSASTYQQEFTGTLAQTVVLPVTSTLALGWSYEIVNNSTGNLTIQSSGLNTIGTVLAGTTASLVCVLTSGTTAASWDFDFDGFASATGTGSVVLATSPTLVTPALGIPASGVVTNLTGTASININGTVGATTASTGAFTTVSATGVITSTLATGTAPFTVASTTQVANLNAATAGTATNATNIAITDNTSSGSTYYPVLSLNTSGNNAATTSSTKIFFAPSTGKLTATTFSGSGASLTSIPNGGLTNSTISGVSLGSNLSALTAGTGLTATATYNGSAAITFNATGTTINSQTSAYVLVAGDAGKTISITTGGVTVNNSVMSAGNIVSIYNNSGSSQTITQGTGVTLQWAGQSSSSTGNRTLGLYGLATLVYISASNVIITGSGLT
jgi:hypothetical protein